MVDAQTHDITQLLIDWSKGDRAALDKLLPVVEHELRRLAHHYMSHERAGHTLQTTALVNEAFVRLVHRKSVAWQNRAHFFGIAAQLMRTILVDHARSHACAKRGGAAGKLELDEALVVSQQKAAEVIALDDALQQLALLDPQQSRIVELRFFGGLAQDEVAQLLGVTTRTVERDWMKARLFLLRELDGTGD